MRRRARRDDTERVRRFTLADDYARTLQEQANRASPAEKDIWHHRRLWRDAAEACDVAADAAEEAGLHRESRQESLLSSNIEEAIERSRQLNARLQELNKLAKAAYGVADEAAHAELTDVLEEIGYGPMAHELRRAFGTEPYRFDRANYRKWLYRLGIFRRPRAPR